MHAMDFRLLYNRIRLIFSHPHSMWKEVNEEDKSVMSVRTSFLMPVAILVTISSLLGNIFLRNSGLSVLYPVLMALKDLITIILSVELATFAVTEISTAFTHTRSFSVNFKLIIYSITPFLVSLIITRLFPSLIFLNLAGLYGFFLLWEGIPAMITLAGEYRLRYHLLVALSVIIFYFAIGWLMTALLDGLYFTIFK